MKKAAYWAIGFVGVAALGLGVFLNRTSVIPTGQAAIHEFTTFIEGVGTVSAPTQAVVAPMNGTIRSLAQEGQRVEAGDVVLQMDDYALDLQLQQAILNLNAQKKNASLQQEQEEKQAQNAAMLAAQTTGYGLEQFNQAMTAPAAQTGEDQVDIARLQVKQAEDMLAKAAVASVLDGTVLTVQAKPGEVTAAGSPALLVAAMDRLEIDSVFADVDAAAISSGMQAQLYGGCLGDATCDGQVVGIEPRSETQQTQTGTRSAAVIKIQPENVGLFTRLGASVELKIITGRKQAVGVPIEALAQDASGLYVFVLRGGRAYKTPVKVGVLDEYFAEIQSGVSEGEAVALNPADLRNGQKVRGA